MASVVNQTKWSLTKSTTSLTVTIPATTAGNTLIVHANGGALVTSRITNSTGTAFVKRIEASSAQAVSHSDYTCAGGETAVYLSLNGAENVAGVIYEVSGLGAFVAATAGAAAPMAQASDWAKAPTSAVTLPSGNGVLFGAWNTSQTTAQAPLNAANTWRQMGPVGRLWNIDALQPGVNAQFIWASGIADVSSTSSYPPNLTAGQYEATSIWNQNTGTAWCVQALYANAGAPINTAPANPVAAENSLPGTDRANWYLGATGTNANIAGYCDKTSYQPGDTVNFKVDSGNGAFRVEIYRLGWYGWDNFGARNVLGPGTYLTGTPATQPAPTVDVALGSPSCAWSTTATWTIPTTAVPGVYCVAFRSTVTTTNVASGHFIVRPSSVAGKTVSVLPDTTYQAYNVWGQTSDHGDLSTGSYGPNSRSLYRLAPDGNTANFAHRAYAVSFDRPYATQDMQPNTYMFDSEYGVLQFMEAQGYDVTYLSSIDLDNDPTILTTAKLVVMSGHHEYWTQGIYDAFKNAVDAGVNMLVNSSNTALWHTRFAAGDTAKRTMICYKDSGTVDVGPGWAGTGRDPGGYTGTWRDGRTAIAPNNPDVRRENALTGQLFRLNGGANTQMTVPYANRTAPIWRNSVAIQALTTGTVYTTANAVIGDEADLPDGSTGQPDNLVMLSPTSGTWSGIGANANGTIYTSSVSGTASFTLCRRSSGALVFNTGAWRGFWSVNRWAKWSLGGTVTAVDANWQNALLAILYDLGATPVTVTALRPGVDTALTNPATGAPTGGRSGVAIAYGLRAPEDGDSNVFFA